MKRIFLTLFCSVIAFLASNAQTTDTTTTTSNLIYQQIVTFLEHKLNTLVKDNANYYNETTLVKDSALNTYHIETNKSRSSLITFTDFKISKDTSGNIFLNLKKTDRIDQEKYQLYNISMSICKIKDIKKVGSKGDISISILGETVITFVGVRYSTPNEYPSISPRVEDIFKTNGLELKLTMEASNTIETIKNAFLYLSTYCPTQKKDIN